MESFAVLSAACNIIFLYCLMIMTGLLSLLLLLVFVALVCIIKICLPCVCHWPNQSDWFWPWNASYFFLISVDILFPRREMYLLDTSFSVGGYMRSIVQTYGLWTFWFVLKSNGLPKWNFFSFRHIFQCKRWNKKQGEKEQLLIGNLIYSGLCLGTESERKEIKVIICNALGRGSISYHSQTHLQYYFSVFEKYLKACSYEVHLFLLYASEEAGNKKRKKFRTNKWTAAPCSLIH